MRHVIDSTGGVSGSAKGGPFHFTLNTDGRRHPKENALAICTLVVGLVAFVTGFVVSAHVIASCLGAIGFCGGLYAQYVSSTTAQRSLIIVGVVASFVGVALGIAHGGFVPRP
ncbi:hypothetical protein [Planotetraspora sp. GP83]|uniref:hypothetical protein n=1 Tax=Planotetraspora sp. GP83 TaxID=3156264 RepID=UPI003514DA66